MPGEVHKLEPLTFDGLEPVPVLSVGSTFGHRQAQRVYPYVDAAAHEWVGREPIKVRARIAFLNTAKLGLFPGVWAAYRQRLQDGKSGKLRHPEIGEFEAVITSFSYDLDGRQPHGLIADVEFEETILDAESPTEFTFESGSASDIAEVVDQCMAAMGLSYPSGMGADTLVALVDKVTSLPADVVGELSAKLDSLVGTIDRIHAAVQAAVENANALEDAVRDEIQNSVERITLERMIWDFRFTVKTMKEKAEKTARPTKSLITETATTLASLSYQLGTDLGGLIQLNPALLKTPSVPKGSKVLYFS